MDLTMFYRLQGTEAVPCDPHETILVMASGGGTWPVHVHDDIVMGCRVSTIFLGFDHQSRPDGPPRLFETMVFNRRGKPLHQLRCGSWIAAEWQYGLMVNLLKETRHDAL